MIASNACPICGLSIHQQLSNDTVAILQLFLWHIKGMEWRTIADPTTAHPADARAHGAEQSREAARRTRPALRLPSPLFRPQMLVAHWAKMVGCCVGYLTLASRIQSLDQPIQLGVLLSLSLSPTEDRNKTEICLGVECGYRHGGQHGNRNTNRMMMFSMSQRLLLLMDAAGMNC